MSRLESLKWTTICACIVVAAAPLYADSGDEPWRAELEAMQAQLLDQNQRLSEQDERLAEQESTIAHLRREQGQSWMNERRAEEVEGLIREVLSDADTRAALADDALYAGWNGNFFLASDDGRFLLKLLGQIQFRHVLSTSSDAFDGGAVPAEDLDDDRSGFELSRVRIGFKGHVIDPSWKYFIWTGFNSSGSAFMLDATITKVLGGGWSVTAGQFKVPLWREWLVSETRQQFVSRTMVHAGFSGLYTQGFAVDYRNDDWHLVFSLNDGVDGTNRPWNTEDIEGIALTGRAEWMVVGDDWGSYADFESKPGDPMTVVLGGAAHWQVGEYGTSGTTLTTGDEADTFRWTADASLEINGLNLYAAVLGNHLTGTDALSDLHQLGVYLQAGYFVAEDLEVMARWEWGDLDVSGVEDLSILTVGFSKMFDGHRLKWTTDVGYAFNELNRVDVSGNAFGWPSSGLGWRPDAVGADGQVVVRSQIQLLF